MIAVPDIFLMFAVSSINFCLRIILFAPINIEHCCHLTLPMSRLILHVIHIRQYYLFVFVFFSPRLQGLLSLHLLDLSGNLFLAVPRNLPPSVQQLYMSNNTLIGLDEDSLRGFLKLKYLRLSHCGLQSSNVYQQVFNFTSLVELDLSHNKLKTIPTVATTLQYLYLEANEIQGGVHTWTKKTCTYPKEVNLLWW